MLRKTIKFTIIALISLYAIILIAFWFLQSAMIYPDQGTHLSECNLPKGAKIFHRNIDGGELDGIFTAVGNRKLLIFFHGNAESACAWRFAGINHIAAQGYDTLVIEYPGYAGLSGKPSLLRNDAMTNALAKWLAQNNYEKTAILGYSLGSGIASMLSEKIDPDAVLLFAPFDKMANVIRDIAPFIPSFIVHQNYQNDRALSEYEGPVTIIHGAGDMVISPKRSEALANSLTNVDRIILQGKGHNGLFETAFFDQLLKDKLP